MENFELLVDKIIQGNGINELRNIIEKEILHQDILQSMKDEGYLNDLTFIGGTCLRRCYNSQRLSEDLDFTGGFDFSKDDLCDLRKIIIRDIYQKYGFQAEVTEPSREEGNTDTWKIKIITQPKRKELPSQKINIDICSIPSHQRKVSMIKNLYNVSSNGLILYAQSLDEIFVDKIIAFTRRPNKIKYRDLYDIHFLNMNNIRLDKNLLRQKLDDRRIEEKDFNEQYKKRIYETKNLQNEFLFEMRRFLPKSTFSNDFITPLWWEYLLNLLENVIF